MVMTTTTARGLVSAPSPSSGKTFKLVATYRQFWVNGKMVYEGDVFDMAENDAKTAIGLGRARLFDPATDGGVVVHDIPKEETVGDVIAVEPTPALHVGGTKPEAVTLRGKKRGG